MTFPITFAIEGFGLNLNLFETNIINLALVIFGLYKFLPGFLGSILERRREGILSDLKDAENRLLEANDALLVAKKTLLLLRRKQPRLEQIVRPVQRPFV